LNESLYVSEEHVASIFRPEYTKQETSVKAGGTQVALLSTYFRAGFLFELFFNPEDLGDMFLRNTEVDIQRSTQLYIQEDRTHHNHRCEHLKSFRNYN
jgi:hypothetical protein